MTHPFRKRRLALLAASTAIAAGGVLVPTTAFAATPATPHTIVADGSDGDNSTKSNLLLVQPPGSEGTIKVNPDQDQPTKGQPGKDRSGQWGKWGKKHPGKGGSSDDRIIVTPGKPTQWQCIVAPCGPPEDDTVAGGIAVTGTVDPPQLPDGRTYPG
ncbi:hypothetical protein OG429_06570 [Streptomyces sp. NBC_00190]|uniref:hypothetical protein n=1 Tax=unclassified Streptomyces TaxID=2593676 RepID=UPI002E2DE3CE|nr:hypothetical protein [Streptomyces sp. NBC_00190]WSZ39027.1 hypothetical protein OG239_09575 [Streptomyces sp. NBC_00868]